MLAPRIGITTTPGTSEYGLVVSSERAYADAVLRAGGVPLLLPVLDPEHAGDLLATVDGLLLSGGGDIAPSAYGAEPGPEVYGVDPERDAWEIELVRRCQLPVLGICRGAQVLNVARGGTLVQHLPHRTVTEHRLQERPHDEIHLVELEDESLVREAAGTPLLKANTLHHQSVDELGDGLHVTGRADDGTIEAIEAADRGRAPVIGVQWHPELLVDREPHRRLFEWLVDAVRRQTTNGVGPPGAS
ncbi:MAG: gamma-glutamyl-gamma-aminobutyrate hydrolase family protein [Aquihabitans sp.]